MPTKSMDEIAGTLKGLKFGRKLFGGVSEDDVWRALENLQRDYRALEDAERARSQALIDERDQTILRLRARLRSAGVTGGDDGEQE